MPSATPPRVSPAAAIRRGCWSFTTVAMTPVPVAATPMAPNVHPPAACALERLRAATAVRSHKERPGAGSAGEGALGYGVACGMLMAQPPVRAARTTPSGSRVRMAPRGTLL